LAVIFCVFAGNKSTVTLRLFLCVSALRKKKHKKCSKEVTSVLAFWRLGGYFRYVFVGNKSNIALSVISPRLRVSAVKKTKQKCSKAVTSVLGVWRLARSHSSLSVSLLAEINTLSPRTSTDAALGII
jgi:hypothetical protein